MGKTLQRRLRRSFEDWTAYFFEKLFTLFNSSLPTLSGS